MRPRRDTARHYSATHLPLPSPFTIDVPPSALPAPDYRRHDADIISIAAADISKMGHGLRALISTGRMYRQSGQRA